MVKTKPTPRKGKLLRLNEAEQKMLNELAVETNRDGNNWIRNIIVTEHKKLSAKRTKR